MQPLFGIPEHLLNANTRLGVQKFKDLLLKKHKCSTKTAVRDSAAGNVLVGGLNRLAQQLGCTLNPARRS
jgi:hypothetical protein